jgi:hypothetical protein
MIYYNIVFGAREERGLAKNHRLHWPRLRANRENQPLQAMINDKFVILTGLPLELERAITAVHRAT